MPKGVDHDERYGRAAQYEEDIASTRDANDIPDKRHFDASDQTMRIVGLHLARAHAALEQAHDAMRENASGGRNVRWNTPLSECIDGDDPNGHRLRSVNLLEAANIVTVGDLITTIEETPAYLAGLAYLGERTLSGLLAAMLRYAVGR
jgi:hypothetical protein